MAHILIPTPLRKFTDNTAKVELKGSTVLEALQHLGSTYPTLEPYLLDGGRVKPFIKLFLGDTDILALDKEQTLISDGDTISIIPAIAGGKS